MDTIEFLFKSTAIFCTLLQSMEGSYELAYELNEGGG